MKRLFTPTHFFGLFFLWLIPSLNAETTTTTNSDAAFSLHCPANATAYCTDELWDLSEYGNAYYHDYNGYHDAGNPSTVWNLNMCNLGTIVRTWTVEDYNWNIHTCSQTITVINSGGYNQFDEDDIYWPEEHITLEGCYANNHPSQLPPGWGYPTWNYTECSNVGVSFSDQVYNISATCKKIVRKWQVMDWCQYVPNSGSNNGLWTYYQFIKISKGDIPVLQCLDDITVNSSNCVDAYVHADPLTVDGEACGGDFTITNDSPYADENGADLSGTYPVGWHTVKFTVEYGCGKRKSCFVKIKVTKNKPPTPYCYYSLAVPLMPVDEDGDGIPEDGMVEVWAKDLDKGSTASCNGGELSFSFSSDVNDTDRTFTCEDVGVNEVQMWVTDNRGNQSFCVVLLDVQNNGANIPDCEPMDDPGDDEEDDDDEEEDDDEDDNGGPNGDNPNDTWYYIGGQVFNTYGEPMDDVLVELTATAPDTSFSVTLDTTVTLVMDSIFNETDSSYMYTVYLDTVVLATMDTSINFFQLPAYTMDGRYRFAGFAYTGDEYVLQSSFEGPEGSGRINQEDLHFMMEYVVGNIDFENYYQKVAADVNTDGSVDFTDLQLVLDYLTGQIDQFPGDYQWLFIDENQTGATPEDVYDNPATEITVLIDTTNVDDQNFVGIRLGDVVQNHTNGLTDDRTIEEIAQLMQSDQDIESIKLNLREYLSEEASSIKVYPNPAQNKINIAYGSKWDGKAFLSITSLNGQLILKEEMIVRKGKNMLEVDIQDAQPGIMIYHLIHNDEVYSGKVLKL